VQRIVVLATVAALASACRESRQSTASTTAPAADATARPNYYQDVYPIIAKNCIECHTSANAISGRSLSSYDDVVASAPHLGHVVGAREMPPWGVDNAGACGEWRDPRWLSNTDVATILAWLEGGTPEGDPDKRPQLSPKTAPLARLSGPPTRTLTFGGGYQPTPGSNIERCFVVDPQLSSDGYLTQLSLAPSTGIRQVTLFAIDSPAGEQAARDLDAKDAAPGYSCTGARMPGAHILVGGTWNNPVVNLPDGTGMKVSTGQKLIAEVEYDILHTSPDVVKLAVDLTLVPNARPATWIEVRAQSIALAPNLVETTAQGQRVLPNQTSVLALYPQMRRLGRSMDVSVDRPAGKARTCMMSQFHWTYDMLREPRLYATPRVIEAGSLVTLTCHYNTQGESRTIVDGVTPDDEECAALLYTAD